MSNNVENLSPQIIRGVVREMQSLVNEPPEGIKVQINDEDVTDIQSTIEGPAGRVVNFFIKKNRQFCIFIIFFIGTPYAGGFFKVKLTLGKDFPQTPPKAYFLTKIFHPNVAANGEICVNTLKKDWKPDLGIKHILLVRIVFLSRIFGFINFFSDHKVPTHCAKCRISLKSRSRKINFRTLR